MSTGGSTSGVLPALALPSTMSSLTFLAWTKPKSAAAFVRKAIITVSLATPHTAKMIATPNAAHAMNRRCLLVRGPTYCGDLVGIRLYLLAQILPWALGLYYLGVTLVPPPQMRPRSEAELPGVNHPIDIPKDRWTPVQLIRGLAQERNIHCYTVLVVAPLSSGCPRRAEISLAFITSASLRHYHAELREGSLQRPEEVNEPLAVAGV